jgi:hypothetical protein
MPKQLEFNFDPLPKITPCPKCKHAWLFDDIEDTLNWGVTCMCRDKKALSLNAKDAIARWNNLYDK